ncbi:MAG: glycoside hydrolase family 1 protein, partial [Candidatus Moranbacteria bacterium]|nr:glycoside hydrolase family 1 protein [Candidatus Moranbacteria bacterium]
MKYTFPENFLWGAATSSYQVEGGVHNDWTQWEQSPQRLRDIEKDKFLKKYPKENYISGQAADHYNRFEEDFALAKELGHNAMRFSIEWSRIEPEEGYFSKKGLKHYKKVLETLKKQEIEPFVTLWHWTLPIWLAEKGGWQNKETIEHFARYCEKVVESFGENVRFWITLNEPEIYAGMAYLAGTWPPQKRSPITYLTVLHNLAKGHKRAYEVIRETNKNIQVGIAKNNFYFEAYENRLINHIPKKIADWWWNDYFLKQIKDHQDFIGLNHYFHMQFKKGLPSNENKKTSDLRWELHPGSIFHTLEGLRKYKKPVYITENGLADARDEKRAWFICETVKNMHKAIERGVDLRGYLHWSLLDNFEWDKGFWPRFGLIEVDRQTQKRTVRSSAKFYGEICKRNGIDE